MTVGQSYAALDLHSHRRKMLRFVWVVMGGLLVAAFALPQVIAGREPLFPIQVQAIFLGYLIFCYVISRWRQLFWLAPHMLLAGLLVMLTIVCFRQEGINTPASHFIALIPALCALTMSSNAAILHTILAAMSIALITIVEPGFQIRHASTNDLLNASTLILNSIIVAVGAIYISKHQERLIKIFRGKSSFDELTGLPNRYLLRNQFWEKLKNAQEKNQQLPGVMAIGIDHFIKYNDENGEEAGDMLLVQAANTISSLLPASKGFSIGRTHGV
ncbi:MAG: diguanylate cyclase, partial [Pseudomonadales bacterium]